MQGEQSVADLLRPAPGAGGLGGGVVVVGDGLQLAEQVRVAQRMPRCGVGVIGGPRVVDGGAGEAGQDVHLSHRFGAAFAVEEQSGPGRGGRGVQPVVAAFAAQSGFVEVHHRGALQPGGDLGQEFGEVTGGAAGHSGDGAVGERNAEQFADGLGGPLLGQELAHEQVEDDRAHHRPVLHRSGRLGGNVSSGGLPAVAAAADDLMFGDVHFDRRDVEDLPAGAVHFCRAGQVRSAPGAAARFVADHYIRAGDLIQRLSAVPLLTAGLALGRCPQRPGRGLAGAVVEGGWEEFCELVRNCASRSAPRTFNAAFSARRKFSSVRISTIRVVSSSGAGSCAKHPRLVVRWRGHVGRGAVRRGGRGR